ncbi:MAG: hypothetical protein PHT59_05315, partial [Candidatus Omnitrophica bacterium]|nr:hypothetical protein [Candidatus Omnitrophota bacterium]
KMNELNNTEWQIELVPLTGKGKKEFDAVIFRNNQVSIASYSKKGFPTTNYTLTIQGDGRITWETMQTSEKAGVAFWRGDLDAKMQTMSGVVSYQVTKTARNDFSFVSTSKKEVPPGK